MMWRIYEGISVDEDNNILFDYDNDDNDDVLMITGDSSGYSNIGDVDVFYAYRFNENMSDKYKVKRVRDYIKKYINSRAVVNSNVDRLIENGVLLFDSIFDIDRFSVLVSVESSYSESSSVDSILYWMTGYADNTDLIESSIKLIKDTYDNAKFDENKAYESLINDGRSEVESKKIINRVVRKFNSLKESGELFQIKRFLPRCIRSSFSEYIKFKNDEEKEMYKNLQGVEVLIYDDFLTSGSTLKEISRVLRSINPDNKLSEFVLIKQ